MSLMQFGGLLVVYLLSLVFILTLTWRSLSASVLTFICSSRCCSY